MSEKLAAIARCPNCKTGARVGYLCPRCGVLIKPPPVTKASAQSNWIPY